MSGLMDKVKDKVKNTGGSGDKPSGIENTADKQVNTRQYPPPLCC